MAGVGQFVGVLSGCGQRRRANGGCMTSLSVPRDSGVPRVIAFGVIGTETAGIGPDTDELIGISVAHVEIAADTGQLLRTVEANDGWREPLSMSEEVEDTPPMNSSACTWGPIQSTVVWRGVAQA